MTDAKNKKVTRNPQVTYRSLEDGSAVLLDLESGSYHGLNETGSAIWELIDGQRTRREIADALRARLDDPPPELDDELTTFLDGLLERGLVSE